MRRRDSRPIRTNRLNYFIFSIEYLVLTSLIYAALVVGPYAAITHRWELLFYCLSVILIGLRLLYVILNSYFTAVNKPGNYALRMTITSLVPPVIGPVIVLLRSLE